MSIKIQKKYFPIMHTVCPKAPIKEAITEEINHSHKIHNNQFVLKLILIVPILLFLLHIFLLYELLFIASTNVPQPKVLFSNSLICFPISQFIDNESDDKGSSYIKNNFPFSILVLRISDAFFNVIL